MSERNPCKVEPEQMRKELLDAGWLKINDRIWEAPAGSRCSGYFLGPYGAWQAMRGSANATVVRRADEAQEVPK